jgi:hypothetical protein
MAVNQNGLNGKGGVLLLTSKFEQTPGHSKGAPWYYTAQWLVQSEYGYLNEWMCLIVCDCECTWVCSCRARQIKLAEAEERLFALEMKHGLRPTASDKSVSFQVTMFMFVNTDYWRFVFKLTNQSSVGHGTCRTDATYECDLLYRGKNYYMNLCMS